jgi:amidase
VYEASIAEMMAAQADGRVTARELVAQSLARIAAYEERLNATISVNADALREAEALDRERAQGRLRGPLHGIPIALKDNIHTTHLPTTGGALAFAGFVPPYEATVTRRLREAGAVIVAKTALTELANWVAGDPTIMPPNYSAVGGFTMNPYDPRPDPREKTRDGRPALATGGSSSGVGTAASFWAASVGTGTAGSILSPANATMLAAVKPTVGRVSRHGIIPIALEQDTAGPMARTVRDAALLLGVMEGVDPQDPATGRCPPPPGGDYVAGLRTDALRGARVGIPRAYFYDKVASGPAARVARNGLEPGEAALMSEAVAVLRAQGAEIVDPADIPSVVDPDPDRNFLAWDSCGGGDTMKGTDGHCSTVLKYGFRRDFQRWLDSLGRAAPVKSLAELRAFNRAHERAGAMRYNQWRLDASHEMDLERDRARFEADRRRDLAMTAERGIDAAVAAHRLDALLFPGRNGAGLAARAGYPTVIVPFGFVPHTPSPAFPEGFDARPQPMGVSFTGAACSEPRLLALAHAFEQATRRRVPPPGFGSLESPPRP